MKHPISAEKDLAPQYTVYSGRLAIQQRVLPAYRAEFFDSLADNCQGGLSVFAGQPIAEESIAVTTNLESAKYIPAQNMHLGKVSQPFYTCWQRGLLRWLDGWQPDILIVEANPRLLSTYRAIHWMHARSRPVIGWGLGVPGIHRPRSGVIGSTISLAQQRFYHMFDGMIAYSQRGAEEYAALGVRRERVFVAPNAVVHRPSTEQPRRPEQFSGRPVVLFVGRLQDRKRVDNLLGACAGLPAGQQPSLLIVGDGPARVDLERLAQNIYPEAEFTGSVIGTELDGYFARADIFVLPGTGGLAVQQAMGHGLAVIAAEGDGTQDDLVRPENGWRVPPNDTHALQAALQEALSDPVRLRMMGLESYRIVRDVANIESMVAGFLGAIAAITARD